LTALDFPEHGRYVPVPVRVTLCGLPAASSWTFKFALRELLALGVKVTLIVQLAPTATLVPQLLVWAKFEAFVELIEILLMVSGAVPIFDSVTVCGALVVFNG
jgi:hypothetical protein